MRSFARPLVAGVLAALLAAWTNADLLAFHHGLGVEDGVSAPRRATGVEAPTPNSTPAEHSHAAHNCALAAAAHASHAAPAVAGLVTSIREDVPPYLSVALSLIPGRTASGLSPPA